MNPEIEAEIRHAEELIAKACEAVKSLLRADIEQSLRRIYLARLCILAAKAEELFLQAFMDMEE